MDFFVHKDIEQAGTIPSQFYKDPKVFAEAREKVFAWANGNHVHSHKVLASDICRLAKARLSSFDEAQRHLCYYIGVSMRTADRHSIWVAFSAQASECHASVHAV